MQIWRIPDPLRSSVAGLHQVATNFGPGDVQPFGTNGVGLVTGHPVGLLLVIGVILIAITGVPAVRWFFGGALLLGGAIGCLLWLHGR